MSRLRTLLVEDEPRAMDRLRMFVQQSVDVEIVGECGDGLHAVENIRRLQPDLVFLDIQIPEKNGFDVLLEVGPAAMPLVIFVTAYDEYAVKAFEICALDYILKPFDASRVKQSIARARALKEAVKPGELERKLLDLLKMQQGPYLKRILIKSSGRLTFLNVGEIDWIKSDGNYMELHHNGVISLMRGTLGELESQLNPDLFLRAHRSVIVRVDAIREIQPAFARGYLIVMKDGTRLPLSRRHARMLPAIADSITSKK